MSGPIPIGVQARRRLTGGAHHPLSDKGSRRAPQLRKADSQNVAFGRASALSGTSVGGGDALSKAWRREIEECAKFERHGALRGVKEMNRERFWLKRLQNKPQRAPFQGRRALVVQQARRAEALLGRPNGGLRGGHRQP